MFNLDLAVFTVLKILKKIGWYHKFPKLEAKFVLKCFVQLDQTKKITIYYPWLCPITGKSFSEAFFLASTNPQYEKRLFIELQVQNMKIASSEHKLFWMSKQKTIYVHNMFWACSELAIFVYWTRNSTNNLSSYCGLVDAKIRASDKDLPVLQMKNYVCLSDPKLSIMNSHHYSHYQIRFASLIIIALFFSCWGCLG
jgi:hypothetical protein